MSSSVGRLCFHRKNAHRLCFIFGGGGGGGGVEIRPVVVGVCKRPFFWPLNGPKMV